jgi:hypothetical protein
LIGIVAAAVTGLAVFALVRRGGPDARPPGLDAEVNGLKVTLFDCSTPSRYGGAKELSVHGEIENRGTREVTAVELAVQVFRGRESLLTVKVDGVRSWGPYLQPGDTIAFHETWPIELELDQCAVSVRKAADAEATPRAAADPLAVSWKAQKGGFDLSFVRRSAKDKQVDWVVTNSGPLDVGTLTVSLVVSRSGDTVSRTREYVVSRSSTAPLRAGRSRLLSSYVNKEPAADDTFAVEIEEIAAPR